MLEEILHQDLRKAIIPIHVYIDSSQLFKAIASNHLVTEKLLRITIAELKELIGNMSNNIHLYWIPTEIMLSDCLTKMGASSDKLAHVMNTGKLDFKELQDNRACLNDE